MASTRFDPMTSTKDSRRLHQSGYVWSLVCGLRFFYLSLEKFLMAEKGGQVKPQPIIFDAARNMGSLLQLRPTNHVGVMVTCFNIQTDYMPM